MRASAVIGPSPGGRARASGGAKQRGVARAARAGLHIHPPILAHARTRAHPPSAPGVEPQGGEAEARRANREGTPIRITEPVWRARLRRALALPAVDAAVVAAIVASSALVLWELSMEPGDRWYALVESTNDFFTGLFAVELSARFIAARSKRRFFARYWIDLIAIVPQYRTLRVLRVFRLLRLFRFGLILTRRVSRWFSPLRAVRAEYLVLAGGVATALIVGAVSIRVAEEGAFATLSEAMWYAALTFLAGEPVGGEPTTGFGRVVTAALMFSGLVVFAFVTGIVSALMTTSLRSLRMRGTDVEDLEDHIVICGWSGAGRRIIEELLHDRRDRGIVVVTEDHALEDEVFFRDRLEEVHVVHGDHTRLETLRDAGVDRARCAVLLADTHKDRADQDRDARTVLAAMLIEKLNASIYTIVQLLNRDNEASLRQIGVEEIVVSEEYVGNILASVTRSRGVVSMLDELLTTSYGHQFIKDAVPASLVGATVEFALAALKREYDAILLGVDLGPEHRGAARVVVNPPADLVLEAHHALLIAGSRALSE